MRMDPHVILGNALMNQLSTYHHSVASNGTSTHYNLAAEDKLCFRMCPQP